MRFWSSAEIFRPARAAFTSARDLVERHLLDALAASSLGALDVELRYMPVVMPVGMRERYPARSKVNKRERFFDCAPQLNYDLYLEGTLDVQIREYVRGMKDEVDALRSLGASDDQIEAFRRVLKEAEDRAVNAQSTLSQS